MKLHRLLPGGIWWCLLAWLAVVVPLPASADVVVGGPEGLAKIVRDEIPLYAGIIKSVKGFRQFLLRGLDGEQSGLMG